MARAGVGTRPVVRVWKAARFPAVAACAGALALHRLVVGLGWSTWLATWGAAFAVALAVSLLRLRKTVPALVSASVGVALLAASHWAAPIPETGTALQVGSAALMAAVLLLVLARHVAASVVLAVSLCLATIALGLALGLMSPGGAGIEAALTLGVAGAVLAACCTEVFRSWRLLACAATVAIGWLGLLGLWEATTGELPVLRSLPVMSGGSAAAMIVLGWAAAWFLASRRTVATWLALCCVPLALWSLLGPFHGAASLAVNDEGRAPVMAWMPSYLIAWTLLAGVLGLTLASAARRRPRYWAAVWGIGVLMAISGGVAWGCAQIAPTLLPGAARLVSPLAAFGLVPLGLALAGCSPSSPWERSGRTLLAPAMAGLLVVLMSVVLWAVLERQQSQFGVALERVQEDGLETALRNGMDAQVTAIVRMAKRFSVVDGATRETLFDVDAEQYLDDLPGLLAIGYVDGDRVLRSRRERAEFHVPEGTRVDIDPERRDVFDAADASGKPQLSAPLPLLEGLQGALVVAPLDTKQGRGGYVVGVMAYDRLFSELLASQAGVRDLRISQGGQVIHAQGTQPRGMPTDRRVLSLYGQQWQLDFYRPSAQLARRSPQLVLLLGFALGGMLAVALRLHALARERAHMAEAMGGQLREQVHVRDAMRAALADAERDMVAVLESISDGVFMVDPEWRFTYVNPQAALMLQADASSLLDVSCWAVLDGVLDDGGVGGALHQAWTRALQDGRPVNVEAAREEEQHWYELRAYPHARGLTVYLHDVSTRKQRERELLKGEADSRHALQLARMGSWELHLRSGYLYWSPEACAIYGVDRSPGEDGMEALRQRVHPDDWVGLQEDQQRLERGEGTIDRQYRMIRPDGEVRVIRALAERVTDDGDPIVAGAVQDITEQERAREVLARALEATQLVMDSAPDAIIALDRRGRFLRVNAAARRLWGYAPESLVGESMARLIHPDDVAATFEALAKIPESQETWSFRNRNLARDGRVLCMEWTGAWSEQAQCAYVVGRDYTDLHRAGEMDAAQRRILTSIVRGQPLSEVLNAIVLAYELQQPEALCSVLLLRDGRLYHGAAPHLPRQYLKAIDGASIGPEAGSCGTAAWRRERVVVSDIATDPLWQDYASLALPHGLLACWSTPILARDGSVFGTFAVYYGESREPTAAELSSIDGLTALASIAIEHDRAFHQLSESEQRFRSLFEHHPDAVFALDVQGWVLQANAAASSLLGGVPGDLQSRHLTRFVVEQDRDNVEAALASAAQGEAGRLEVTICDGADGRFPGYLVTLPIMVDAQAHGLFAVLQDLRELRRTQQLMASQLGLLSAVAESVGEGLLAVNEQGHPTFLNRTAARLLDLPAHGLPQAGALPQEVCDLLGDILEGRGFVSDEDAAFTLDNSRRIDVAYVATPLLADGRLAGAVLAFRDIADIKEARRSLRERERFFELSLEVFCIFDARTGHFVQANPALCRLLGYDEATLLSMPLADLVHPQDRLATEDAISWQYESGEPLAGFANRLQCADGSAVWLEWTSKRVPDGMIFAVARDVTAKRKADAALAKAMDDLRIRNRELQDFAYVASHDLQEPLRKIQAFSDRLQSRLAANLDDSSRDYLKRMGDAASRMQTLIDDLLAYSRVGTRAAAPVEVDLARELATVLDDLDARVQEAGAVVEAEALPSLQADASQMRQLLQNLLANALKFRAHDRPCRIRISACPLGEPGTVVERWQLSVEDNGIGFDPAYAERIFAPFQRLHPRNVYGGTGIGLAIVRRIVERHGGTIRAEGRSGEGARFIVTLPARAAASLTRVADDIPLLNTDLPGASR